MFRCVVSTVALRSAHDLQRTIILHTRTFIYHFSTSTVNFTGCHLTLVYLTLVRTFTFDSRFVANTVFACLISRSLFINHFIYKLLVLPLLHSRLLCFRPVRFNSQNEVPPPRVCIRRPRHRHRRLRVLASSGSRRRPLTLPRPQYAASSK
jgi:hypothetical protein